MRTVNITEDFTGYPAGKEREFKTGETPELANDYADLVVAKGHAEEVGSTKPVKKEGDA